MGCVVRNILIIEPEKRARSLLIQLLKKTKAKITALESCEGALKELEKGTYDLIFSKSNPRLKVHAAKSKLICLGSNRLEAVEMGAIEMLPTPIDPFELERILKAINPEKIISESPEMKRVLEMAEKVAKSQANVFIFGESGTGKEVIASFIHLHSKRKESPFIKVNCAALPEALIESEFFGHEKGAYTGASIRRIGRFELADNGTLLLDEVTEIPLSLQAKLLRAVQEQEFERLGGTQSIKVNVRFISTSNRNMKEAIQEKVFREDLYYRLNVVPLYLPPLRERKGDIIPLAEYFLQKSCEDNQQKIKSLSEGAMKKLLSYSWPGNIRELSNVIEHAVVLSRKLVIEEKDLNFCVEMEVGLPTAGLSLEEVKKRHILETLKTCNNNRTKTAEALGVSVRTLRNKLKKYLSSSLDK